MTDFFWPQTPHCASNELTCGKCGAKPGEGCKFNSTRIVEYEKKISVTSEPVKKLIDNVDNKKSS